MCKLYVGENLVIIKRDNPQFERICQLEIDKSGWIDEQYGVLYKQISCATYKFVFIKYLEETKIKEKINLLSDKEELGKITEYISVFLEIDGSSVNINKLNVIELGYRERIFIHKHEFIVPNVNLVHLIETIYDWKQANQQMSIWFYEIKSRICSCKIIKYKGNSLKNFMLPFLHDLKPYEEETLEVAYEIQFFD